MLIRVCTVSELTKHRVGALAHCALAVRAVWSSIRWTWLCPGQLPLLQHDTSMGKRTIEALDDASSEPESLKHQFRIVVLVR